MAILINAHQLTHSFGARPLFRQISFAIETGEKVGLIGPNGAGKSTLMRILAGQVEPDEGTLSRSRGVRVGFLEQVPQFKAGASIEQTLLEGARDPEDWNAIHRAQSVFSEILGDLETGITLETPVESLSGGWQKRVALARELMGEPELLCLDEPTNHLDVESILWLEKQIRAARYAVLTITHDRWFLQNVSNRILELDPRNAEGLLSVKGDYAAYLETKESLMSAQESREIRLKNTLRRETEWLRRGAKARTTKQQARIERTLDLKDEVAEIAGRNRSRVTQLDFQGSDRTPKKLIDAQGISKRYRDTVVVPKLDLLLTPKSRIGLLGRNGCGKSTLIKLLLGEIESDTGKIERSEHLQVAYFEQNRDSLDPTVSVLRTICPVGETVDFCGTKLHIKGYLDRFLFSPAQFEMAIGKLSGGEQCRVLLARLMLQPANVLVLDEPTNDLDLPTLNVLEEVLETFQGAVILVTHDRMFLERTVKELLAFGMDASGQRRIERFAELAQWEAWFEANQAASSGKKQAPAAASASGQAQLSGDKKSKKRKLSFKEQRELDGMEGTIAEAEAKLTELRASLEDPAVTSQAKQLLELTTALSVQEDLVAQLYQRWGELGE